MRLETIKKIQDRISKLQMDLQIATLELEMILETETIADENSGIDTLIKDIESSFN